MTSTEVALTYQKDQDKVKFYYVVSCVKGAPPEMCTSAKLPSLRFEGLLWLEMAGNAGINLFPCALAH
eukprot:scaffold298118_cov13-Tisochrysis_lutea.AAC.1